MRVRNLIVATGTTLLLACPLTATAHAVDTTPPVAPEIFYSEAYGWQPSRDFVLAWMEPPAQDAPIDKVHYEICRNPSLPPFPPFSEQPCADAAVSDWEGKGEAGVQRMVVTVPNNGYGDMYDVRIWLEDADHNVDPDAKSDIATLRHDPLEPFLSGFGIWEHNWLNEIESDLHIVEMSYATSPAPKSGIAGYSITRDGTLPDASLDVAATDASGRAMLTLYDLGEGLTELKARAISGAGVPAGNGGVTTAVLMVDKSPPSVSVTSALNLGSWQRHAVALRMKGLDQAHLSGMHPAGALEQTHDGAYVAYRVDGGALERVRGDDADVTITTDGIHSLSYQAFDTAGNRSGQETAEVKIDGTAPSALFEPTSSADPLRLEVATSDKTSGVAEGKIEMQRDGSNTYRALETRLDAGKLVATLDDDVPDGRYVLRVRVRDRAGNETISEERIDGRRMMLTLPVRTPTRMRVERLKRPVGHGVRPAIRGQLTKAGGEPLRDAVVTVLDGGRSGKPRAVGLVRTDAKGRFRHRAPARLPSRSIRYSYAGTKTIKPVFRDVPVKVRAGVTLSTNRTWLLNGQSVVFSGRLAGPVPKGGKVVALQARKRSGWVTFGTPRANKRGVFRLRYRFTSTTGLQKYRFRAVAVREGAYPYNTGASRPVTVTVRGL